MTGRAIPLVQLVNESTGEYALSEEARDLFGEDPGPFGVIAIAGKYRTGKSLFLNRCLLQEKTRRGKQQTKTSPFPVGNTVQACTKGLWLYSVPVTTTTNPAGRIFVLDTEGIGALDATDTNDTRIFAMALLLSSFFIYNSLNAIDEEAVNQLSLVTNVCKQIQLTAGEEATPEELGREVFPPLYWLVRDFSLQLKDEFGRDITPDQYLEFALKDRSAGAKVDSTADYEEKNRVRRCLRECFPRRGCATLIRPCAEEANLQWLQTAADSDLRPVFRKQLDWVRDYVLHATPIKTTHGTQGAPMTGKAYLAYADAIVGAINSGSAPAIRSTWSLLAELHCREALEQAMGVYRAHMETFESSETAPSEASLLALWRDAKQRALESFRVKCGALGQGNAVATQSPQQRKLVDALEADREHRLRELSRLGLVSLHLKLAEIDAAFSGSEDSLLALAEEGGERLNRYERELQDGLGTILTQKSSSGDTGPSCGCGARPFLTAFFPKVWVWLRRIRQISESAGVTLKTLEEERASWRSKLEEARAEHKATLESVQSRHAELEEKLSGVNDEVSKSLSTKESELAGLRARAEEDERQISELQEALSRAEEQQRSWEDSAATAEASTAGGEAWSNLEDKLRAVEQDRATLKSQLEEAQRRFLSEVQSMQQESRRRLEECAASQKCALEAAAGQLDLMERQKTELENRYQEQRRDLSVRAETCKRLQDQCMSLERSCAKAMETHHAQWDVESAKLAAQVAALQEKRVAQQIEWGAKLREAESTACRKEAQAQDLKRRLESITDPVKIKRLKQENAVLQRTKAQIEKDNEWLRETNRTVKADLERTKAAHDKLHADFYELQCDKERAVLKATLETYRPSDSPSH